ncbi:D-hexose-6-phosphate mutarotase [Erwinia sp. OLTSP20]|uniref:D-hexose-6-phosphate mutarotase n=1 Tax=unclassified Erwinia TaxID=2622719 RepID=UPI000C1837AF|nr:MULTISPECIES: D-hexose-6-phosphate mutarotase [unclassified Erwinia]PIJ51632.1 D-hexose-6-phosphate mutarotase [Erwinia sp. OAMSP11]PIJ69709.1 D-hexose-6-phosphate mutarotase [Erwinia sp. OLSSP12]PIJ79432.1 D-hexose-6-phosphate mutarotase [Erwinia sp. OLCASP19]PIJ86602.1 D-hexose-6-phosphate mutarotase [Erwinia sp. OLMTSP26]PIJ88043.1 D-hexose-6-phosphate mutarotase [Erwinia sp. OLMDSP33]
MTDKLFSLPIDQQLSPYISQRHQGEQPVLVINHPRVRAAVALQGAHLVAWQPAGEAPVIWLSENSLWQKGKAIRGGVPICWPWFGPAGEPAHGFARNLSWSLSAHDENDDSVMLTLVLESNEQSKKYWPHDFTLYARFRFSQHCEIELEAHGDYTSSGALHSYFQVADIAGVSVSGLGHPYTDKVLGIDGRSPDGIQRYPDRIDRIYRAPEDYSIIDDERGERVIEVYHHHHSDVVTWNPGPALSSSMSDMTANGYKTMVCVETAHITTAMHSRGETPARLGATFRLRKRTR